MWIKRTAQECGQIKKVAKARRATAGAIVIEIGNHNFSQTFLQYLVIQWETEESDTRQKVVSFRHNGLKNVISTGF